MFRTIAEKIYYFGQGFLLRSYFAVFALGLWWFGVIGDDQTTRDVIIELEKAEKLATSPRFALFLRRSRVKIEQKLKRKKLSDQAL